MDLLFCGRAAFWVHQCKYHTKEINPIRMDGVYLFGMVFRLMDSKGGSWRHAGGMSQPPWLFRRKASPLVYSADHVRFAYEGMDIISCGASRISYRMNDISLKIKEIYVIIH